MPIKTLPHGEAHRTFVVLVRPEGSIALGRLVNVLRFTVKEIDPSTGAQSLDLPVKLPAFVNGPNTEPSRCALKSRREMRCK